MTQTSMPQLTVTLPPREQNTAQVVVNVPTPASSGSTTQNSGHPNYSMMRSYSVPTGVTSPVSMSEQQNPTHIKSLPTSPETTMDSCAESEASECTVCYERSVNAVLYTCGHMCMCFECAIVVKNHKSALCPICRQEIKDVIKIYKTWCLWRSICKQSFKSEICMILNDLFVSDALEFCFFVRGQSYLLHWQIHV